MKKTKEDATSAGTPKKKKPQNKGRLSSMLESMQKRSSPVNAHKVATKYFEDFKKDRSIPDKEDTTAVTTAEPTPEDTAVPTTITTPVSTAVVTAVEKKPRKTSPSKIQNRETGAKILDDSHTRSEAKIYLHMRDECLSRKKEKLRFGLKELKEKTGLSDKTIRNAIHSLEKKLSIEIVEPSLGIYGRKIRVFNPNKIAENRKKAKLIIDTTTKKIIDATTAVDSAVTTAVKNKDKYKEEVKTLYENYTGRKWDEDAEKFYKSIENVRPEVVESALILGTLKDKVKNKKLSDFKDIFRELGDELPEKYLDQLRDIWKGTKG
ncbi:MAG: hypothetical protein GTN99_10295 [Candidatus Dadabacteria bacterium]|nr:hypothetical protein [Candidatus Dadabacteria bacterium]